MTKIKDVTLGGQTFSVPPLVIEYNREVYPLCAKLSASDLLARWVAANGVLRVNDEEMADLMEIAFHMAGAAGAGLSRKDFDQLPINPVELVNTFFVARYQTGVWLEIDPVKTVDADDQPGEAKGMAAPRKSRRQK